MSNEAKFGEQNWSEVKISSGAESVHLETWPESHGGDQKVLVTMKNTRAVVSLALEARAAKNIKIRQPLAELSIGKDFLMVTGEFAELVKDEVNIKKILNTAIFLSKAKFVSRRFSNHSPENQVLFCLFL